MISVAVQVLCIDFNIFSPESPAPVNGLETLCDSGWWACGGKDPVKKEIQMWPQSQIGWGHLFNDDWWLSQSCCACGLAAWRCFFFDLWCLPILRTRRNMWSFHVYLMLPPFERPGLKLIRKFPSINLAQIIHTVYTSLLYHCGHKQSEIFLSGTPFPVWTGPTKFDGISLALIIPS